MKSRCRNILLCLISCIVFQGINPAYAHQVSETESVTSKTQDVILVHNASKNYDLESAHNVSNPNKKNIKLVTAPLRIAGAGVGAGIGAVYGGVVGLVGVAALPVIGPFAYVCSDAKTPKEKWQAGLTMAAMPVMLPIGGAIYHGSLGSKEGWHYDKP